MNSKEKFVLEMLNILISDFTENSINKSHSKRLLLLQKLAEDAYYLGYGAGTLDTFDILEKEKIHHEI